MAKIDNRIKFLAKQYNIFMHEEFEELTKVSEGTEVTNISVKNRNSYTMDVKETILALIKSEVKSEKNRIKKTVYVHEGVFANMLAADPTPNKMYLQWMLNVFTRLIKNNEIDHAIRFAHEDLPQASEYLELFEGNKRKQSFKRLCQKNYSLKGINDPTNINQYKNLAQLFDAVDPFIERNPSNIERVINKFVEAGEALLPVRDRNFTIFVPLTKEASAIFADFTNWCTAKIDYTNFEGYTSRLDSFGNKSKLYIIIDNRFFSWDINKDGQIPNEMLYQLHVESGQLMHRGNAKADIYDSVITKSDAVSNYLYEELMSKAKAFKGSPNSNAYVNYLIEFGHTDALFDMLEDEQPIIRFNERRIPKLPDMSRFKNLKMLFLGETGLKELNPTLFGLPMLRTLALPDNHLKSIPSEIGKCKSLIMLNLVGNPISEIPDEIAQLDRTKGGSLYRFSIRKEDIGEANYEKLRRLLPSVKFSASDKN